MADISQLSNEEIRAELLRFGYHVGPVTQYSRNVYIKRLQQLLSEDEDNHTKSDIRTRLATLRLSTLSSEEDTDEAGTAASNRGGRKKRRSSHFPSSNVPYRNSRAASNIQDPCIVNAFRVPVIRPARRSILERATGEVRERAEFRGRYADYSSGLESSESDEADARSGFQSRKKNVSSDVTSRAIYHSKTAESRRKLLPTGTSTSSWLSTIRSVINPLGSLMSGFSRRSRVSDSRIENNGYIPQPSRFGSLERQGNRTIESFPTTEERNWFSRNCQVVPKTLVLIVMLFFLGLAVSYAALGRVKSYRSHTGNNYPICSNQAGPSRNCVPRDKLHAATSLFKIVAPLIQEKSEEYACLSLYGQAERTLLTSSALLAYVKEKGYFYDQDDIKNMDVLILFNRHWGYVLNRTGGGEVMYVYTMRAPVKCYLMYHLSWFVNRLVEAALCVMVIYIIFKLLSVYKAHAEAHKRNVRAMVGRITKFLRTESDNNAEEPFFVVVDYVRDQLIPAKDYKRMALVWTSAVNFIRHNDPRIKEEQCVVNGELKTVWRWLPESGNASSEQTQEFNKSSQGRRSVLSNENFSGSSGEDINQEKLSRSNSHRSSKIWQGQAFETMAGSPNSVPCSPTPCLKIRHMFDPDAEHGEDWPTFIRDAILEKCEGVAILHLFVDKASREGCVYVKCQTPEDAGRAYCALHGWWFGNSHLVTVKYLRIERYHERFPEAVNAKTVLKPSNNQRLSLGD
ncbi:inner nuclear membrane protein Man1 isoform X1 [Schistocerca nitens]|uniref:inner nuclear membrane protein Man1 isoform X1 n=2 Tax=Schistocerca nitens TaxID=7011 RepID=UPI0021181E1F|nr:inner nuclear membrane protein Man1 isoform X1 [Schistocerca nitens]